MFYYTYMTYFCHVTAHETHYHHHHHHHHFILVITCMQGIYNYIPETNYVSTVYSVAAVQYLQSVLHVMSKRKEPRYMCLSEAKASHSHRMWAEVSSASPHFLHNGLSISPSFMMLTHEVILIFINRIQI